MEINHIFIDFDEKLISTKELFGFLDLLSKQVRTKDKRIKFNMNAHPGAKL